MFDRDEIARARALREAWEGGELRAFLDRQPESRPEYRTLSGLPLKRVYTAEDLAEFRHEDLGLPGQYPYTRGPYPTMYRGRLWTMRQIAGFGTGEDTNGRFRYLIEQGQTGLSVSMTINPTAWILLAMYVALAQSRSLDLNRLSGTVQADILKEYIAQKEWAFPIRPSMRIMRDMIVWSARNKARYNPINISGYHISEAGATSVQELAFTMANAVAYVEEVTRAGVPVDEFAPRLAFYFVSQNDFFEEIAKFRAARRIYARLMKERFGARKPESMRLRFHCQTAAATLTRAQPMNNVVRTTLQALSAVLGGAQSLHTNGLDEAYAIPSEEAMKLALRTQQIIAEESRVAHVIDPLGGSYFLESLTNDIERRVLDILAKVDALGGTIKAVEDGYFQKEIAVSAYETARRRASGEQPLIGVNRFVEPAAPVPVPIHKVEATVETRQVAHLREVRRRRDGARVQTLLERLATEARDPGANLMPVTIEAVKARATLGEIVARLREVFGTYVEKPVF